MDGWVDGWIDHGVIDGNSLEYACLVWSTSLPKYLSDAIEMIQLETCVEGYIPGFTLRRYADATWT